MQETIYDNTYEDDFEEGPSKSQIKRELLAITELGKKIIELPFEKIKQLPFDEKLLEAIQTCQKIKSREGKRRQTHYVGKLLRHTDIEAVRRQLDTWEKGSKENTAQMHQLENLRERLLQDDQELTLLLNEHPHIDIQQLRSLIRVARKEQTHNATLSEGQEPQRKHYRALFQFLKSLIAD